MSNKNKVKFGLSNVYYAKIVTAEDGTVSYAAPVKIPGAVNLSLDAQGEETAFYADNVKYYTSYSNGGYEGDLEIADTPEDFLTDILGQTKDSNGAIIEKDNDSSSKFALMYEIDGDIKKRRVVYYNCTVSRPTSEASTTEDTKEPKTDTLKIVASARESDRAIRTIIEPSVENQAIYDTFYTKVYEPDSRASV